MANIFMGAGRKVGALVGEREMKKHVDLKPASTTVHHGFMPLPQELVDQIVDLLRDDIQALKACSLTCKVMFASTRHLIHQTLSVASRLDEDFLTTKEKNSPNPWLNYEESGLRYLSSMAERGLLRYPRRVHIRRFSGFVPSFLLPQLHNLQSLDQVHTLIIERCQIITWADHYKTCYVHLYTTLTTLWLSHPFGHYRFLLQFALQFPNLENLCLEWFQKLIRREWVAPIPVSSSPPLRGHLRLAGANTAVDWPINIAHELPNGMNFRSVELEYFYGEKAQRLLDKCARTLEDLTIAPQIEGSQEFLDLKFTKLKALRRFTLCTGFPQVSTIVQECLLQALQTIKSPVFCEFTLELGKHSSSFWGDWGHWEEIDKFLEDRFSPYGDFRFVIKVSDKLCDMEVIQSRARVTFPLLAGRDCIHFERFSTDDKRWLAF